MNTKSILNCLASAFMLPCMAFSANAQAPDNASLAADLATLKTQLSEMRSDVAEIKDSVAYIRKAFEQAREKSAPVQKQSTKLDSSSSDDFVMGSPDAPITIMEFFDFQCGFCAKFNKTTFPQIKKQYIDTGKVRFVFRDYILSMHAMAVQAASLATCAQRQGKYFEMHEVLFENPELLGQAKFQDLVMKVPSIDIEKMEACLQEPDLRVDITDDGPQPSVEARADMVEGDRIGVMGTPAFFIGKTVPPGQEMSGVFIRGDQEFKVFQNAISDLLK
ncbi:MAG: DsbA family protein [Deltaproteobacteria bacterium]|nr:DsbA family protein [Deltaproteobacteria bacterium]